MHKVIRPELSSEVKELVPGYLQRRRADLVVLAAALQAEDYQVLSTVGHQLKGSGVSYGCNELSTLGASLEQAAKARNLQESGRHIRLIEEYMAGIELLIPTGPADEG